MQHRPNCPLHILERGSLSLGFVLSVTITLSMTLIFVNLVRYVGATNAVSQAARSTARCVTPTDPECVDYSATPTQVLMDWYGYHYDDGSDLQHIFVDQFDYSATMYEQTWRQEFDTYRIHKVYPTLTHTTYQVPSKTFERPLNTREYVYAKLLGCAKSPDIFESQDTYLFPHASNAHEVATMDSGNWSEYCMAKLEGGEYVCCKNPESSGCDHLRPISLAHQTITFEEDVILSASNPVYNFSTANLPVPDFIEATSETHCTDGHERDCQSVMSGSAGGEGKWWKFANLAIKAEARVCPESGDPTVRWSSLGVITNPPVGSGNRDLGGRAPDAVGGSCRWYNLWLRGPRGSHGGGQPGDHENIRAHRGGTFRFYGSLTRESGTLRVDRVRFRIYMDRYSSLILDPVCYVCPGGGEGTWFQQRPPLADIVPGVDGPASPQDCGHGEGKVWSRVALRVLEIAGIPQLQSEPTCDTDPATTFPVGGPATLTQQAAVCTDAWQPSTQPPANRLFCGNWSSVGQPQPVTVGTVPASCPLATAQAQPAIACDALHTFTESGNYGSDILGCSPAVGQQIASVNAGTDAINNSQPSGAPTFGHLSPASFTWGAPQEDSPPRWEFAWQSQGGGTQVCACGSSGSGCSPVTCVEHRSRLSESQHDIYRHVGVWSPDASYFPPFSALHPQGELPPQGNPDNLTYALHSETAVSPTGYPFDGPAYARHWGNPSDSGQFDYDLDCLPDDHCQAPHQHFGSLGEWLRHQAASSIPAAIDPALVFEFTEERLGTAQFNPDNYPGGELPPCTNQRKVCEFVPDEETMTYLGRFSNSQYPQGPQSCHDQSYDACTSQIVEDGVEEELPEIEVNHLLAKAKGCAELRRFDPSVPEECDNVSISVDGSPYASVAVTYNMGVTPPLNLILGSDYIPISSEVSEVMETRMVGRVVQ